MVSLLFSLLFLPSSVHSYVFYHQYPPANCGEIFDEKAGITLPDNTNCDVKIEVPEGKTFTFTLIDDNMSHMNCKKIMIVDESTQTKHSLCPSMRFAGNSQHYSIRLKGLLESTKAQIDFADSTYHCGQVVPRERIEHSFTFLNNGGYDNGCYLIVRTSDIIRIVRNGPEEEDNCETRLEISQGRHVSQMVKSTGLICLGSAPLEASIECGMALVYLHGPVGQSVEISTRKSKTGFSLLHCEY